MEPLPAVRVRGASASEARPRPSRVRVRAASTSELRPRPLASAALDVRVHWDVRPDVRRASASVAVFSLMPEARPPAPRHTFTSPTTHFTWGPWEDLGTYTADTEDSTLHPRRAVSLRQPVAAAIVVETMVCAATPL